MAPTGEHTFSYFIFFQTTVSTVLNDTENSSASKRKLQQQSACIAASSMSLSQQRRIINCRPCRNIRASPLLLFFDSIQYILAVSNLRTFISLTLVVRSGNQERDKPQDHFAKNLVVRRPQDLCFVNTLVVRNGNQERERERN